jgi:hypothetical protein
MRIVLSLLLFFSFSVVSFAQETPAKPVFAPGGLTVIPPDIDYESVASRIAMTEVLAVMRPQIDPDLQDDARFNPAIWATEIPHRRNVWCLEFSFKRVRIVEVDIPNAAGNYDKKKVWYLVYQVKNLGPAELDENKINSALGSAVPPGKERNVPVPEDKTLNDLPRSAALVFRQQTGIFAPKPGNSEPIRFVPQFILAAPRLVVGAEAVENPHSGQTEWKTNETAAAYPDRILPLALLEIQKRERMATMPETTVSIAKKEIAPGQELCGVAMWTDVDPRINEFSIFVSGLTNAYLWSDRVTEDGEYVNTGTIGEGRIIKRRVLRTDWWRVGDQNSLNESQFRFGAREETIPESILDQTGTRSPEERQKRETAIQSADVNQDGWVSPAEKAIYHLIRQDWPKPSFGYEWVFL